jgi:hypothetical protein
MLCNQGLGCVYRALELGLGIGSAIGPQGLAISNVADCEIPPREMHARFERNFVAAALLDRDCRPRGFGGSDRRTLQLIISGPGRHPH